MTTDVTKLDKVAAMYRTYVHMRHGKQDELTDMQAAIKNLQDGEILQITPKGGDLYAEGKRAD